MNRAEAVCDDEQSQDADNRRAVYRNRGSYSLPSALVSVRHPLEQGRPVARNRDALLYFLAVEVQPHPHGHGL